MAKPSGITGTSSTGILYKPKPYMGINLWTLFIIPIWVEGILRFLNLYLDKFPNLFHFIGQSELFPFGSIALFVVFIFLALEIIHDFSYSSSYTVQISERGISGPQKRPAKKGGLFQRAQYDIEIIPFDRIDTEKSFKEAKLGYHYIYALDGRMIFLHPRLGPTQIADIETQCLEAVSNL